MSIFDRIDEIEAELLPCPHCGGKATMAELHAFKPVRYAVQCTECQSPADEREPDYAIDKWNRRVLGEAVTELARLAAHLSMPPTPRGVSTEVAWTKDPPGKGDVGGWFWVRLNGWPEIVLFDREQWWIDRIHWRTPNRYSLHECEEGLPVPEKLEWWPVPLTQPGRGEAPQ